MIIYLRYGPSSPVWLPRLRITARRTSGLATVPGSFGLCATMDPAAQCVVRVLSLYAFTYVTTRCVNLAGLLLPDWRLATPHGNNACRFRCVTYLFAARCSPLPLLIGRAAVPYDGSCMDLCHTLPLAQTCGCTYTHGLYADCARRVFSRTPHLHTQPRFPSDTTAVAAVRCITGYAYVHSD